MADPTPPFRLPGPDDVAAGIAGLGRRLSAELAQGSGPATLIGIERGGAVVARALRRHLPAGTGFGLLDPSFHRDDFAHRGLRTARPSDLPMSLEGHRVILVDDVLHTGRTVRAALEVLFERGRVGRVWLAVLIDRPGRELPISADAAAFHLELPAGCRVDISDAGEDGDRLQLTLGETRA